MTRIGKTIVFFIIVIIIAIGAAVHYSNKSQNVDTGTSEPSPLVDSSSVKGCYVTRLAKDVYTLQIESEQAGTVSGKLSYNNYEKDSSSGPFSGTFDGTVLLGDYSFDSEGMHSNRQVIFQKSGNNFIEGFGPVKVTGDKEVFEDISKVTYDPKSTFVGSPDCVEHFTDSAKTFSFDYNSFFAANEGDKTLSTDWKVNSQVKGTVLASVSIPHGYMPQTNFGDGRFTVGRSNDPLAIKNCTTALPQSAEVKGGTATISGYPFTKITAGDAGAGNLYETTSYRGIVDGDCYAIEYTIHSTNIGNYDPSQGIKEFDKVKVQSEFEKIVKSFKFLTSSN